jgi:hypothetical protein
MHAHKHTDLRGSPKTRATSTGFLQFIMTATTRVTGIINIYIPLYYLGYAHVGNYNKGLRVIVRAPIFVLGVGGG